MVLVEDELLNVNVPFDNVNVPFAKVKVPVVAILYIPPLPLKVKLP